MEINIFNFRSVDGTEVFDAAFNELGYLNATEAYQFFGKPQSTFDNWKTRTLIPYAEKLIELGKIAEPQIGVLPQVSDLIIVKLGGDQSKHEVGTWLHPKLAIVFARWIKLEFEIWCDEKISELLANGMVTLQPEDQEWVDYVEGLVDLKPGSKLYMEAIRSVLLIHEKEGYNIKAFKDLIEVIKNDLTKELQTKVFKKLRQLIKDMYEDGKLSRTSHEAMLELCVDTVVEVLEKEVRSTKIKLKRIELKGVEKKPLTMQELAKELKSEADTIEHEAKLVVDAQYLYAHKILGLDHTPRETFIPTHLFGAHTQPVCDCVAAIKEAGMHIAFSSTLYPKLDTAKPGSPAFKRTDPYTNIGTAIWFNEDGSARGTIQKTIRDNDGVNVYKQLADLRLISLTSIDPGFYTGSNPENTIRMVFQVSTGFLMVYGYNIDKK